MSAIMLLLVSAYQQIRKKPFYDPKLNRLELFSICTQIVIIYFGLFYLSGKNDEIGDIAGFMWIVFFVLLCASIFFLANFLTFIRLEMLKSTVKNRSFLFKILSCGRIKNKQEFIDEHHVNDL